MIQIGEITRIPYTTFRGRKKYTRYTYLIEFLNKDNNVPIEIITPKTTLKSDMNILNIETKIKGDYISCNVKLNIIDKTNSNSFYLKVKSIEDEIYNLIRNDYSYIQIIRGFGIENIQTKTEMKDAIHECIRNNDYITGTISIMGCITLQNTFEIIYTLEKIKKINIINEIINILHEDENLLNIIEEELYDKIENKKKGGETITICDIKTVEDVEFLQSEINKIINE
jgi:hypothetical protein